MLRYAMRDHRPEIAMRLVPASAAPLVLIALAMGGQKIVRTGLRCWMKNKLRKWLKGDDK